MHKFLEVALAAAREAGAVLLAEHSRPQKISYKGDVDLVTETDKRSEAIVVGRLRREFPDHRIVAEEGSGGAVGASRYEWHVDPLDGTTNFAHGYPCFAVSIGLLEDGQPLVGVVFNSVSDELFSASRGEGAYLNGKPIRVSEMQKLATSLVSTGFPTHNRAANVNIHYYWQFTLRSHGVRRDGSAALDLCSVACGRFDAFWEFGLHSWDTAAGILMVTEAGGKVTNMQGGEYRAGGPDLLVTNGHIHAEMLQAMAEISAHASKL
ncbi:MAG: inositol monophosphatase family protein [Candidatus Acidiferrales bacterium]